MHVYFYTIYQYVVKILFNYLNNYIFNNVIIISL